MNVLVDLIAAWCLGSTFGMIYARAMYRRPFYGRSATAADLGLPDQP